MISVITQRGNDFFEGELKLFLKAPTSNKNLNRSRISKTVFLNEVKLLLGLKFVHP